MHMFSTFWNFVWLLAGPCRFNVFFWKFVWAHLNTLMFQHIYTYHADIHYVITGLWLVFPDLMPIFFLAIAIFSSKLHAASTLAMQALYRIPLHMIRLISSSSSFYFSVEICLPPEWWWKKEASHCAEITRERSTSIKRTWYPIIIIYSFG